MSLTDHAASTDRTVVAALIELASARGGEWETTLQHILRVEARVLDVERVSFWTLREDGASMACEMAYFRRDQIFERGVRFLASEHPRYFEAIQTSTPLEVEDARADPRLESLRGYLDTRRIGSLLDFPVWADGKLAGLLCHEHVGGPRRWSSSDEHFAASVAETAAAALEARARAEARKGLVRAEFLDRASRSFGETLEVDGVGRRAAALLIPTFADGLDVVLTDDDPARRVVLEYKTPEGREVLTNARTFDPHERRYEPYVAQRVASRGESILIPDLSDGLLADTGMPAAVIAALGTLGMISAIAVPLTIGERLIGVATMATGAHRYGLDDLTLAEAFAQRLAGALENARLHEQAQAAVRARDEFILLAGHELRTPLTSLQLSAQQLLRRATTDEIGRLAGSMVRQIQRLDRLSAHLLDATRIHAHQLPMVRMPTDLAEVARDTADTFGPTLQRAGCSLTLRAEEPAVGEWDGVQLGRMLSSLLDNAAKFGAGKPVEVEVRREGDAGVVSVRDHGPGIPPDRIHRIFESFERAVSARHYGGLGLGLFVAKAIAEGHGGTLSAANAPDGGATFTARLPMKPAALAT